MLLIVNCEATDDLCPKSPAKIFEGGFGAAVDVKLFVDGTDVGADGFEADIQPKSRSALSSRWLRARGPIF